MKFDIPTIAFISCLIFLTQFVALLVQYRLNRDSLGVGWWLLGSALSAVGVLFTPLVSVEALVVLAMVANPLLVSGQILLFVGVMRFLGAKEKPAKLITGFVGFLVLYYYFMFVSNDISARTFVLAATLFAISLVTALNLFLNKDRLVSGSANLTALVFLAYACFSALRACWVLISPPIRSYSDLGSMLTLSFVVPIVASLLWTFGFIIMMNQRLAGQNREETDKLQRIFNTSPDAAMISRLSDGSIVDVNIGFSVMSGYTRAELIGNTTIGLNVWHNSADREQFLRELKDRESCDSRDAVFQRKDGSLLTGSISARIVLIQAIPHVVSIVHDITGRRQAEEALRESEALYRSILDASPDDITITDLSGSILVISPAAKRVFGYEAEYDLVAGSQVVDYIVPEDRARARSNIMSMINDDYVGPNEYRGIRKDRSTFDIEVSSGLIRDANRRPTKMVFVIRDITERKLAGQRIQQLVQQLETEKATAQLNANTDSLTGLANRRYFDEVLDTEFHRLRRSESPLSLVMLDVDHFKGFNDTYGHVAGDDCLKRIGTTLRAFVRSATDFVARYGGEEFVVILSDTDQDGAAILAERIRKAVEALAIPHSGSDAAEHVTVSLGVVTVYPTRLASAAQVVALADEALYCSKDGGRNRTTVRTVASEHSLQPPGNCCSVPADSANRALAADDYALHPSIT